MAPDLIMTTLLGSTLIVMSVLLFLSVCCCQYADDSLVSKSPQVNGGSFGL